jgi:hypothetical protein
VAGGVHFYGNQAGEIWGETALNKGRWHHVCATWDNDTDEQHIYVDGVLDDLSPVWVYYGGRGDVADDTVRIGFDCSGAATSDFVGRMDDVAIFDVTLTAEQVVELMHFSLPATASNPGPEDKTTDLPLDEVALSWNPGVYAGRHDVYFGTDFNDVNDAGRANQLGVLVSQNQVQEQYPTNEALDLDYGTTYYWRIDEVNAAPDNTIFKGKTWQFETEPITYPVAGESIAVAASSAVENQGPENTVNGSGMDEDGHSNDIAAMWISSRDDPGPVWIQYDFDKVYKLVEMLVWNHNGRLEPAVGFGFKDVTVEYSTNGGDFVTLGTTHEFGRAPGASGYSDSTSVDFGGVTVKSVRLTAGSNWGGILNQYGLSEVHFMATPVSAREPYPASGAMDVDVDVILRWRAGREAVTHDVYLSTDEQAVIDGTAPLTTVTETSFVPSSLDVGTVYYWAVDEVNDAESPTTWLSDIWSFATVDSIVVDNFEFYNDVNPDQSGSNRIFDKWIDGYETVTNGALVGNDMPPYAEQNVVYSGFQAMPYFYDNNLKFSEAELTLSPAQNWTEHGVTTLVLHFQGDPANAAEQMYVKVNDFKVTYDGDPLDITAQEWKQWRIDLASLGINLTNVTKIAIGFGDGTTFRAGGSGVVYFDDIGLYR